MNQRIATLLTILLAMTFVGCDGGDSDRANIDDLRESIAELKQTVADMEFRIARLEAERKEQAEQAADDEPVADGSPAAGNESLKPTENLRMIDFNELTQITLPTNPTKQQVIEYVRRIHDISQRQTTFGVNDPQVAMLTRVGPEHVDVLINLLGGEDTHLVEAIRRLATDEHKQLILQFLPIHHHLVRVVTSKGWEEDARQILISQLANRQGYLPLAWIQAVASFEDPETYDYLKAYFAFASNHAQTYEVIKDLPGIELDEAVAEAWKRARHEGVWEAKRMAAIAIDYGHVDALGYLIRLLASGQAGEQTSDYRAAVLRRIEFRGSDQQLDAWFEEHADRLTWDAGEGKFEVGEKATSVTRFEDLPDSGDPVDGGDQDGADDRPPAAPF